MINARYAHPFPFFHAGSTRCKDLADPSARSRLAAAPATRMTQRAAQRTTVRKTLRTPPRAWACRRTRDAAVGQRWGRARCTVPVHRQRVRQTVARMSRARETEHLSFRPVPAWPFSSSPPSPAPLSTYRIASSSFGERARRLRTALAEEGWLCTNSPTWDAHFRTLSSSTLLARAALHLAEHLRTRSHPPQGPIPRSWRVTSGPRSDRGRRAGSAKIIRERCRSTT